MFNLKLKGKILLPVIVIMVSVVVIVTAFLSVRFTAIISSGSLSPVLEADIKSIIFDAIAIGTFGLSIAIIILYRIVGGIIKPVKSLGGLVFEVAQGNLNINTNSIPTTNDEIGDLILDVNKLINVIKGILGDISGLTHEYTEYGDFEYRINIEKYKGSYREMIGGINALLGVTVDDMLLIINYLDQIINGNFNVENKQMPGKKIIINIAVENLRKNIIGVNNEINRLIKAVIDGKLKTKGITETFKGDWRELIGRLNKLMAVIRETYLDICPEALLILDKDLNPVYSNKLYYKNFGENSVIELIFGNGFDPQNTLNTLLSNISDGHHSYQLTIEKEKETKFYAVACTPIMENNEVISIFVLAADITDLTEEKERALEASNAKSAFLARMSHELRTPMNTIIGMNELILREEISDRVHQHAQLAKRAGVSMLALINDILDFSKVEARQMEITPGEYSFASLIHDVTIFAMARLGEKPVRLTVNTDSVTPSHLIGDDVRIRQIFLNLISNAIKYTNDGYVNLMVECEILDDTAVITAVFADSGIGIKEEDLDSLFLSFSRVDAIRNRSIEGTGLGLSITKELCQLMGGSISVKSEYGVGSTFTVSLPQKFNHYEKLADIENPEEKSVLLYEPRSFTAQSCARTFENLGVPYRVVASMQEFNDELNIRKYAFVFVPQFLYETASMALDRLETMPSVVLITEFDESSIDEDHFAKNIRKISSPMHSLPVANILNGVSNSVTYSTDKQEILFVAPYAKALIVDDISTNLMVAEALMAPYKMQIDICKSGEEAIEMIQKARYDIVFMDHSMPGMDGVEATQIIRELVDSSNYYKEMPIIALTAHAVSGMREMFLKNGMSDFLSKPIDISKLNDILKRWIPKEKQQKSKEKIEKVSAADILKIKIDGVNVQTGVALSGGTIPSYIKTLNVFYRESEEKINTLNNCIANNDIKLYTTVVHGLKGALLNIGAEAVADIAKSLETAGKEESFNYIKQHNSHLLSELDKLLHNINDMLVQNKNQKVQLDAGERRYLRRTLGKLKNALNNMETKQMRNLIQELEKRTWDEKSSKAIESLSRFILLGEFDEAVELIEALL